MADETITLAEFAAGLGHDEIPASVKQRAKDSIADTIATMVFGRNLPWSRMIIDYAREMGNGGKSHIMGDGDAPSGLRKSFLWRDSEIVFPQPVRNRPGVGSQQPIGLLGARDHPSG